MARVIGQLLPQSRQLDVVVVQHLINAHLHTVSGLLLGVWGDDGAERVGLSVVDA